uniref:Uncharacterized protein n=1 Tax=Octopus bimaculoides TaxID=37653 RepID=A0A0L8IDF9_OCTBM
METILGRRHVFFPIWRLEMKRMCIFMMKKRKLSSWYGTIPLLQGLRSSRISDQRNFCLFYW